MSEQLLREPWRFGFYQATRLFEWIAVHHRGSGGTAARNRATDTAVGEDGPAGDEAVRFRATASARFPADEVLSVHSSVSPTSKRQSLDRPASQVPKGVAQATERLQYDRGPYEMIVGFFGLTGPKGILPTYFHRLLRRRLRARDRVLRDFLDIFNHRALSLFYRAWLKYRFPLAYERVRRQGTDRRPVHRRNHKPLSRRFHHKAVALFVENWRKYRFRIGLSGSRRRASEDEFSRCLLAVVGLGTPGQRGRHEHLEPVMIDFAGFFGHLPRSAIGMERILVEHFDLPIQVLQFQGQWLLLEAADRSHLGGSNRTGTSNNRLGGNAVLGDGVWDVESRFRIRIGPLQDLAQFYRFLPLAVGDDLQVLRQLVRVYAGPDLEFDVQLVLPGTSWLRVELGGDQERCPLLGWNVWLRDGPFETENGDAVFSDEVLGGPSN